MTSTIRALRTICWTTITIRARYFLLSVELAAVQDSRTRSCAKEHSVSYIVDLFLYLWCCMVMCVKMYTTIYSNVNTTISVAAIAKVFC